MKPKEQGMESRVGIDFNDPKNMANDLTRKKAEDLFGNSTVIIPFNTVVFDSVDSKTEEVTPFFCMFLKDAAGNQYVTQMTEKSVELLRERLTALDDLVKTLKSEGRL